MINKYLFSSELKKITYAITLILFLTILYLSNDFNAWFSFFKFFNVPAAGEIGIDLNHIFNSLNSRQQGFNPYLQNPYDKHLLVYPIIWLDLFDALNIENPQNLYVFKLAIITSFLIAIIFFIKSCKNNLSFFLIILYLFSTSNLLLIERVNIDIIIFNLVFFSVYFSNSFLKSILFLFSVLLKIYPIFSLILFIKNKKYLIINLILCLLILFFYKDQIESITNNVVKFTLIFAYGLPTILESIKKLEFFDIFLNYKNINFLETIIYVLFISISFIIFFYSFFKGKKIEDKKFNNNEITLLVGSAIYCSTFIFAGNIDYRLVFLLLTFNYFTELKKLNLLIIFYYVSCIVSFYSFYFHIGNPYSSAFLLKGLFVHTCKLYIYFFLVFNVARILRKNNFSLVSYFNSKD